MTIKSMERVYLVCPLNLGDYFVCFSIVRHFAAQCHRLYLPVVPHFMSTVQCLFDDFDNIETVPYLGKDIESEFIKKHQLHVVNFRTVFETTQIPFSGYSQSSSVAIWWDRQIYEHFDMTYSRRYQDFSLPSHISGAQELYQKLNPDDQPFVLWHRRASNHVGGIDIDLAGWRPSVGLDPSLKIIEVEPGHSPNLLAYIELIKRASEIHVVGSSFHCLVDSITSSIDASLFYHDIRKDTLTQINSRWNNYRWHVVEYGFKV